jgi:non-specific serine/threonine protein kinase
MPLQPTPLVGRSQEIETIQRLLNVGGVRLLTLVGPAGVGKTRLALAAATAHLADRFFDGVTLVDLTPVRVPEDVLTAIARACGVTDTSPLVLRDRLVAHLQEQATLLVLDNFEQVLPAAASLADLLAACPNLALLVTSRAPLQIRWEQTLRVAPLPTPDLSMPLPLFAELATIPAVTLFLQRARARRASFALTERQAPVVAQLVAQLDGLPLALELAAARLDVLSLSALTRRLADRMRLLAVNAPDLPERQQSLEAAVGWSYDLLSEGEQRLFRCLGVFVRRVTLDAIAAVVRAVEGVEGKASDSEGGEEREQERETGRALHQLLSLAEKSLLLPARPEESSGQDGSASEPGEPENEPEDEFEPAFGMLETVREYAWERLAAAGELAVAQRAHAHYFLALAERADPLLRTCEQRAWYVRLEREQDNLRAALRWLLDQEGSDSGDVAERASGLRLAGALGDFWRLRGHYAEGLRWLEEALERTQAVDRESGGDDDSAARTYALVAAGTLLALRGEFARARAPLVEGLALAERRQDPIAIVKAYTYLGLCTVLAGETAEGIRLLQAALLRWETLSDLQGLGETRFYLGLAADTLGDTAAAASHYVAALERLSAVGDAQLAGFVRCYLSVILVRHGELLGAVEQVLQEVQTSVALRDRWLLSFGARATVALTPMSANPFARARLLGAADALAQATGAAFAWEHWPAGQDVVVLREQLEQEGWGEAYREGRSLPFGEEAALAMRLLEDVTQSLRSPESARHASENPLTAREVEVLRLVAQGLSSKLIARQLSIAAGTVNYHLATVFNKMGVDTRAQAVAVAAQRGLL